MAKRRTHAFDICEQVLTCIRKILNDDNILYGTDLRVYAGWDNTNFTQLADDLTTCFAAAKHPIPHPINKPKIKKCKRVEQVCDVVEAAFKPQ